MKFENKGRWLEQIEESSQKNETSDEDLLKLAKKITNYGNIYIPVKQLAAKLLDRVSDINTDKALEIAKTIFRESKEDYHDELNPKLWEHAITKTTREDRYYLKPDVSDKLKEIAKAFIEYLDINEDAIEDIVITGSSAGYNYTPYSDLDLHLIVDYDKVHEDCPIVEGFLWSMKSQFNKDHDISIYGVPVELYAEQSGAGTVHNGLYSLMQNKWIDKPKKIVPPDNDAAVEAKYNELKEAAEKIEDSEVAKELLNKLYTMRKAGLSNGGELSTENLAFKKLRNDGTIEKLKQMEKEQIDKELSLEDFSEDPLDEIDEDEEKVFVRNMNTGNSYYINKSHFDKNKHELVDDSQQSSTDTQATSLLFEVHDLKKQIKSLEQNIQKYKDIYDKAIKAIDYPHTNYKEIEQNKARAEKANEYYTLALDKLKNAKSELYKKQNVLDKINKGEN